MPKVRLRRTVTDRSEDIMSRYDDIIDRKYEGSMTHKRMSPENRAAQFAPFSALTGHDAAINETARLTTEKIELSPDEQRVLSERMKVALARLEEQSLLTFTAFQADALKSGGSYVSVNGIIKKYDEYEKSVILTNNKIVRIADIISIDGEIFNDMT